MPISAKYRQNQISPVEVGKSACVLVEVCGLRLSLPARYDPQYPSFMDFLSLGVWSVSYGPVRILHGLLNRTRPIIETFLFLIKTAVTITTRVLLVAV